MLIKNGLVYTENGFQKQDIYIENEHITNSADTSDTIDADGCYIIPGLTDIHFHGCAGHDFCDATIESVTEIAEYEAKNGITSIAPATMTLATDTLEKVFKNAAEYNSKQSPNGAVLCGINMEGPYICSKKKGAQAGEHILAPSAEHFNKMYELSDKLIKLVTLAPEVIGSEEFIKAVSPYVNVSLGHTTANYNTALDAFKLGANHITHTFNAMPPLNHREPGVIGAAADSENVTAEIICDGNHLHPSVIRILFKVFGDDRIILISDSMEAAGLEDGEYTLGGQKVYVKGSLATLEDGTIAGSVTNLFKCMKNAVSYGVPIESAIKCAAVNPAKRLSVYDKLGSIEAGKLANIVITDLDLTIKSVFVKGKKII